MTSNGFTVARPVGKSVNCHRGDLNKVRGVIVRSYPVERMAVIYVVHVDRALIKPMERNGIVT